MSATQEVAGMLSSMESRRRRDGGASEIRVDTSDVMFEIGSAV